MLREQTFDIYFKDMRIGTAQAPAKVTGQVAIVQHFIELEQEFRVQEPDKFPFLALFTPNERKGLWDTAINLRLRMEASNG